MLDLINSLSLESGALVVAVVSAALAFVWARIPVAAVRWTVSVGVPFILASSLYWSPVWLGADSSEFSTWAPLFVGPWFLAGAISSGLLVHLIRRRKGRDDALEANSAKQRTQRTQKGTHTFILNAKGDAHLYFTCGVRKNRTLTDDWYWLTQLDSMGNWSRMAGRR